MTKQEFYEEIKKSGFLEENPIINKKITAKSDSNSNNILNLSQDGQNVNPEFRQYFAGTEYFAKNNCTYMNICDKRGKTERLLCNFVAIINEEITVDDGLEIHKIFKVAGKHEQGYDLPVITVPENPFLSMNWIIGKWGARCIIEPGQAVKDRLRHCIQKISKNTSNKTIFKFTGWNFYNNRWIYLHSGGAIGASNIEVSLDGRLKNYKFPEKCNLIYKNAEEMFEEFTNCAPKKVILPLLAFVFLTPLNEFLRHTGIEPKFIIYLLGKTGCGKSTITAILLSFFGNFSGTELPMSFMDTANSIVSKAFTLKDVLTCVDDYKPSGKYDMSAMDKTAQQLVRSYGERTGRQRLKSDSSEMKQKYPRGNAILTGEQIPRIEESGMARMLILEIESGDVNFNKITQMQENVRNNAYSSIMKMYIQWLQKVFLDENEEIFIELLRENFIEYRDRFRNKLGKIVHPRIPDTLAFLKIGYNYFLEFLHLEKCKMNLRTKEFDEILENLAKMHSEISLADKPTVKFITTLKDMITSGTVRIQEKNQQYVGTNTDTNKPLIGYRDDEFYYFLPKITYNQVCRFYAGQGENFPTTQAALLKQLAEESFIAYEKGRNTLIKQINSNIRARFIWFHKKKFDDFGGISENEVTAVTNNDK